jgi:hypothetical protein
MSTMSIVAAARRARIEVAVLVALLTVACYQVNAPPVPTAERVPTTIGQIVGVLPNGRYELANDEVIDVRDPAIGGGTRTRLGKDPGTPPDADGTPGGLIMAGEDSLGRFYAATRAPEADGCFLIFGPGYLQLDRKHVHLSSGLVVQLSDDFELTSGRYDIDPSWLFDFDRICLDKSGEVTSIHQGSFGA